MADRNVVPAFAPIAAVQDDGNVQLAIGVTGHRLQRLETGNLAFLARNIADLLAEIESGARAMGRTQFRLISNFADGADRIAGDVALERGWTLDALLPFPRDDFARDFGSAVEMAAFVAQLDQAGSSASVGPARLADDDGTAGYEAAGRAILDRCDILIGIWDKGPARGRGGAAQIIGEAIGRNIPVVVIDPRENVAIEAISSSGCGTAQIIQGAVARLTSA